MEQPDSTERLSLPLDLKVERFSRGRILRQRDLGRVRHGTLTSLLEPLTLELLSLNVLADLLIKLLSILGVVSFPLGRFLFFALLPGLRENERS